MMSIRSVFLILALSGLSAMPAAAAICDYRPSELAEHAAKGASRASKAVATEGRDMLKAAGFYTLTKGAVDVGAGATGTATGVAQGASGLVSGATSALGQGVVAGGLAVAAIGAAGFEGVCYFRDERIVDPDEVLAIMRDLATHSDPQQFSVLEGQGTAPTYVAIRNDRGTFDTYPVKKLYIVNGDLMVRDWGLNTRLGRLSYIMPKAPNG